MDQEAREQLEAEWKELNERIRGEFPNPKDFRRMDEITSLLMTDGKRSDVKFNFVKGKDSKRVTSFTRNRK